MPIAQRAYEPLEKYIIFQPTGITWNSSGNTASLNIQSNDDWNIVADGWIQLSRYEEEHRGPIEAFNTLSGNGNTIIGIRCSENTGNTRTGGITGYCQSSSAISATTTVSQSGSYVKPYLALDKYIVDMPDSGMSGVTLIVNSNIDWITSTDSRWIDIDTTSGSSSGTIVFNVSQSDQSLERRGSIYVSGITEDIYAECVVAQSGVTAQTPYIIIVPTDQSVPASGDSFVITVSSNTSWDVSIVTSGSIGDSRTWITTNVLNGYGDDEVRVNVAPMVEEGTGRTGYISFYNNMYGLNSECDIEQRTPNTNKLYYTSTDGTVVQPRYTTGWGANIVSNTYVDGQGVIEFDDDVVSVPNFSFSDNKKLTSITLPESVVSIGNQSFRDCSGLTGTLTIPNSVTSIGAEAFEGCRSLTGSLVIPSSVTSIGLGAFRYCSGLTGSLVIPDSVVDLGSSVFVQCSGLTSISLPNSITIIDSFTFQSCAGLTGLFTIPNSVTSIGHMSFIGCTNLTGVVIGNSVSTIIDYAFFGCSNLSEIYSYATEAPSLGTDVFRNIKSTGVLHYPSGSNYSTFISKLPNTWTAVGDL